MSSFLFFFPFLSNDLVRLPEIIRAWNEPTFYAGQIRRGWGHRLERFRFDGIKFDSGRAIERHFFATPSFESQLVTTDRSSTNYVRSKFRQQDRGSNLLTRAGSKSFLDFSLDILPISLRANTFFLEGKISLWRMRIRSTLVSVSRDIRATRLYSLIQLRIDLHRSNAISKLNFDDG